jgi:hypothetical protein
VKNWFQSLSFTLNLCRYFEVKRPRSPMPCSRAPAAAQRARKRRQRSPVTSSSSDSDAAEEAEEEYRRAMKRARNGDYSDDYSHDSHDSDDATTTNDRAVGGYGTEFSGGSRGGQGAGVMRIPGGGDGGGGEKAAAKEAAAAARKRWPASAKHAQHSQQQRQRSQHESGPITSSTRRPTGGGSQFMPDWDDAGLLLLLNAAEELEAGEAPDSSRLGTGAAVIGGAPGAANHATTMCGGSVAEAEAALAAAAAGVGMGAMAGAGVAGFTGLSAVVPGFSAAEQLLMQHPVVAALESSKLEFLAHQQRYSNAVVTSSPSFQEAVARAVGKATAAAGARRSGVYDAPAAARERGECGGKHKGEMQATTAATAATTDAAWGDAIASAAAEPAHARHSTTDALTDALTPQQHEQLFALAIERARLQQQQQQLSTAAAADDDGNNNDNAVATTTANNNNSNAAAAAAANDTAAAAAANDTAAAAGAAGVTTAAGVVERMILEAGMGMPNQLDIFIQQLATRASELYMVLGPHELVVQTLMALAVACHRGGYAADTELALAQLWDVVRAAAFPGGVGETDAAAAELRVKFGDMVKTAMSDHSVFNGLW